jgi:predicted N-acetyltransferase YhbS
MRIDYLADHLDLAPLLAARHYQEWAALLAEWSLNEAQADLQSHTGRRQIPTTFVAIEQERLLGSASLLAKDLEGWEHLSPWLASVYVLPEFRGRGLGRQLVTHAVEEARTLGVATMYLFTAGQAAFYERLGWQLLRLTEHRGRSVTIMHQTL